IGFIEQTRERRGIGAAADVSDQSSLEDIPAEQLNCIGPIAGASARDVLQATMLSGTSSEQATPPERRPERSIVSGLLRTILWIMIVIVVLIAIALAIWLALSSTPSPKNPYYALKLIFCGP